MRLKLIFIAVLFFSLILRLYQLSAVPMSLNWDEASLGYNAFAISQTLHDEHGEFLPVARFMAYGDYKPPGYIYITALAVKLLGLSEFSVRLTSALSGVLMVGVVYLVVVELTKRKKTGLLAALLLAISPWGLQMSRGAYEANLATAVTIGGLFFFLRAVRLESVKNFILAAILFVFATYTFNSLRIFVPLMVGALTLIYLKSLLLSWKKFVVFPLLLVLLVLPMLPHVLSSEGKLRFEEVTWLNDLAPIELANSRMATDGNNFISKLIHNRRVVYSLEFLEHYTDQFRGSFLFYSGDVNPRLSIQSVGELYWVDLPFLLIGLYYFIRKRNRASLVLFSWLLLAPIPAATARETPHALRALPMLPVLMIFTAMGIAQVKKLFYPFIAGAYLLAMVFYLHDYYVHYPIQYAQEWQYGYKQMVSYVTSIQAKYDRVVVTQDYGRPYIYFLFYEKYRPQDYWLTRNVSKDNFGFWYVHSFDKYNFDGLPSQNGKTLYVMSPNTTLVPTKVLKQITDPTGQVVFTIFE